MVLCTVWTGFGLKAVDNRTNNNPVDFRIASLSFDPGLKVGDKFIILKTSNSGIDFLPEKEMEVIVKQRRHVLKLGKEKANEPDKAQDVFEIQIFVEIAEKEGFQQIRETIQRLNPGIFENIENIE
jgi:hypothetical protein